MTNKTILRLLLPIPLLVDGIRMARGITGGYNTDEIDKLLTNINNACEKLIAHLQDAS